MDSFLQQYPNAQITTSPISEGTILAQLEEIRKTCEDFQQGSYYKTVLYDEASKTKLTIWLNAKDYQLACATKEVGGVQVTTTSTAEATTTTAQITTTSTQATTTTTQPATTTSLPELNINRIEVIINNVPNIYFYVANNGTSTSTPFNVSVKVFNSIGQEQFIICQSCPDKYQTGSATYTVNGLAAGDYVYISQINMSNVSPIRNGTYRVDVNVDTNNTVVESNENNNFGSKQFIVGSMATTTTSSSTTTSAGLPDLNVSEVGTYDTSTYLNFSITNLGPVDAGPFNLSVSLLNESGLGQTYSANVLFSSTVVNGLAAGSKIYLSFNVSPIIFSPGTLSHVHKFNVSVDPTNEVSESNENNNKFSAQYYRKWYFTKSSSLSYIGSFQG